MSRLGLEGSTSRSRLGLEDITSRSRDFSLVNMHAMRMYHKENNGSDPQETGCQVTTSPVGVFKLRHCSLDMFFGTSRSRGGLETFFGTSCLVSVLKVERLISVLRVQRLGLVSVLRV